MLLPCRSCSRHIRDHEVSCPFCGAERSAGSSKALRVASAAVLALGLASCDKSRNSEVAAVYGAPPIEMKEPATTQAASQSQPAPESQKSPPPNMAPMYGLPPKP
jgi:hypothetical protein